MPDNHRLVFTPSAIFEKAVGFFKTLELNQRIDTDEFQLNNLTFKNIENSPDKDMVFTQSYLYLDNSYPRIREQVGKATKTIWLNEGDQFAPGEWPVHDIDILSFDALVHLETQLRNPTLQQCQTWWDEWDLPENIRKHVKIVAISAYILAVLLRRKGIDVDPILAHRGGLMHDIDKIETLNQVMGHGEMGGDFFEVQGYPELAEIVRGHIMHTILTSPPEERKWEDILVYFCDKLVEGDRLVPFGYRLDQLKVRYPYYQGFMEKAKPQIWALNKKICSILSLQDHQDLIRKINENISNK